MEGSRTERNVRTANAQGALSLIRRKPGELKEMCGPYERCSRLVTAFSVRTNLKSKMRTESVRVYWTCVLFFHFLFFKILRVVFVSLLLLKLRFYHPLIFFICVLDSVGFVTKLSISVSYVCLRLV